MSSSSASLSTGVADMPSILDASVVSWWEFIPMVQELVVLAVFLLSWLVWPKLALMGKPRKQKQAPESMGDVVDGNASLRFQHRPDKAGAQRTAGKRSTPISNQQHTESIEQQTTRMLRMLEQKEFTRVLNHWRSLERGGADAQFTDEAFFLEFLQSACRVGKTDVCEKLLHTMKRNGMKPSQKFWQSLMKMFSSRRAFSVVLSAQKLFDEEIPADRIVFSCLINAALECNQPHDAIGFLPKYRRASLESKDYILFFRSFAAAADLESAVSLFRELQGGMTTLMLNLLLLITVNAGKPDDAKVYLFEMKEFEKAADKKVIDTVSYNTLIKGFAQASKPDSCFECLHDMRAYGLEPDDVTFGSLLDVCIADNDMAKAHTVIATLMRGDRPMDIVMCTLFIKGFVRVGNVKKALELYAHMLVSETNRPDIVTFSVLIKALVEARDMGKALEMVEDMLKMNLCPDDMILTHLIEGCRHIANQPLGQRLFDDMIARGVKPSEFTLMALVKLHGRCGMLAEAKALMETWEAKYGTRPSVIHYTCLMSGCMRAKKPQLAYDAYELMCRKGLIPDETTFATMIPGMVSVGNWDAVLSLASRAVQAKSAAAMPAEKLNNALSAMVNSGEGKLQAKLLYNLMVRANVVVTVRNVQSRV